MLHPWWDVAAKEVADAVRGKVKQGTPTYPSVLGRYEVGVLHGHSKNIS